MAPDEQLDRFCGFAERFLTDEQGRPLVIEPFQREILADYFDGARETRRDGLEEERQDVPVRGPGAVARDHDRRSRMWRSWRVPRSSRQAPAAAHRLHQAIGRAPRAASDHPAGRPLRPHRAARLPCWRADSDTLDGWGGTLALVDELARHKSEENFGLLRDGLGPRDGRLIAFSTAGDDEDRRSGGCARPPDECRRFAADPDNPKHKLRPRRWLRLPRVEPRPERRPDDLELVALANPASWLDRAELRRAARTRPRCSVGSGSGSPAAFGSPGEESAINPTDWAACARAAR